MKGNLFFSMVVVLCATVAMAQTPQYIPYQAVARNAAGNLLVNQSVGLRFTIRETSGSGTIDYQETQTTTTNNLGLFSINIGNGTIVSGTFNNIPWGNGIAKYTQVEIDPNGGSSYVSMGSAQMMSVPYALFSGTASAAAGIHTNGSGLTGGTYNGSSAVTWAVQSLNGLNTNSTDNAVELGGTLTKNTTITHGAYNIVHNLTGAGDFEIEENSNPSLYILGAHGGAADGFAGIGTASPVAPLEVLSAATTGSANGVLDVFQPNLTAGTLASPGRMYFKLGVAQTTYNEADLSFNYVGSGGSTSNYLGIGFNDVGPFAAFTANATVGIGTTNPASLLQVNGTETLGMPSGGTGGTPATGTLAFDNSSSTQTVSISAGNTTTGYSMTLPLAQGASGSVLSNNGSGALSWSAPSSIVAAGTGLSFSGATLNSVWTTSGNNIYSNNSANVGIGTTTPATPLMVAAGATDLLLLQSTTGGPGNNAFIDFVTYNNTGISARIGAIDLGNCDAGLVFHVSNAGSCTNTATNEAMRITNSGTVGIGTTTPLGALDVTSTTGALVPPRMTTTQQNALSSPPAGSVVFNTTTNSLNVNTGTAAAPIWTPTTSAHTAYAFTSSTTAAQIQAATKLTVGNYSFYVTFTPGTCNTSYIQVENNTGNTYAASYYENQQWTAGNNFNDVVETSLTNGSYVALTDNGNCVGGWNSGQMGNLELFAYGDPAYPAFRITVASYTGASSGVVSLTVEKLN